MNLIQALDDGRKREITEKEYYYFLEVLPPVTYRFDFHGERWNFGFAEGYDYIYAFKFENGRYFAQKTDLLNPYECGRTIAEQQADPSFVARYEADMREVRRAWDQSR
jgi:hypothetical protein